MALFLIMPAIRPRGVGSFLNVVIRHLRSREDDGTRFALDRRQREMLEP